MEQIRLNKWLGDAGFCSRREADRLIAEGRVTVDGRTAVTGMKISERQQVACDGKPVVREDAPVLLAVHKPRGVVCTTSDKDRAENIVEFLKYPVRIYPVGRLDKDSEGLLLMTNQGDLVNRILRAGNGHEKEYMVRVDRPVTGEFLKAMAAGVYLEELETTTRPCRIRPVGEREFSVILTQGLNRQIRRMCGALGYRVTRLKRIRIMNIRLGGLKAGQYRKVEGEEYERLMELLKDSSGLPYSRRPGRRDSEREQKNGKPAKR